MPESGLGTLLFLTSPSSGVSQTHFNPIYASMVLAWSVTEVIRYAFYAFNVLGLEPYPLLWIR